MCIVSISDDTLTVGSEFAEELARKLGMRYVDDAILFERAAAWGGDPEQLKTALKKSLGLLARFSRSLHAEVLLLQAALAEDIRDGNAVCYGCATDLLNLEMAHVLRIRLHASFEFRLSAVQERLKLSRVEATKYVRNNDRRRERWHKYLFGRDREGLSKHDLVINCEYTAIGEACAIVSHLISNSARFAPNEANQACAEKFALATRIRAAGALDPETAHLDLDISIEGEKAVVRGVVHNAEEIAALRHFASRVPTNICFDLSQVLLCGTECDTTVGSARVGAPHSPSPSWHRGWQPEERYRRLLESA